MIDVEAQGLQGFCSQREVDELVRLARGQRVLEIGCWKGRCTIPMAEVAELVVAIDHWRGDRYTGPANTLPEFRQNLDRFGVRDRVLPIVAEFGAALDVLDLRPFGLLIYDGDHDDGPTNAALWHFGRRLVSRCRPLVVAVHDYNYDNVRECVDSFAAQHRLDARTVDRLAVMEYRP